MKGIARNVKIKMLDQNYRIDFIIVEQLNSKCIIGFDVLRREKAHIKCEMIDKKGIGVHRIDTRDARLGYKTDV